MEIVSESYKQAGVDVTAGYKAVELMKKHVDRTRTSGVLDGIGGFGGLFAPDLKGIKEPVLVSGTDGVGTKLRIAFLTDTHNTIGIDAVAMCVNDIICAGATPLFFLDYLALSKNIPEKVEQIVAGVAEGCVQSGCALIGGETAEMPGLYKPDEYDIAGFAVGVADKEKIINKENARAGDVVLGLGSSGVHSNGFSLIRKVLGDTPEAMAAPLSGLNTTVGEALLIPTRIYVSAILALIKEIKVHSISHITGGGFYENLPRALPKALGVDIVRENVPVPSIFHAIQQAGGISESDMFATFNMGIGMAVIVAPQDAQRASAILEAAGEKVHKLGTVTDTHTGVEFI